MNGVQVRLMLRWIYNRVKFFGEVVEEKKTQIREGEDQILAWKAELKSMNQPFGFLQVGADRRKYDHKQRLKKFQEQA
jgi:hypothetical protein